MEIVFEPDISDGEEAAALTSELIGVLEALGTCNCKMEGINNQSFLYMAFRIYDLN